MVFFTEHFTQAVKTKKSLRGAQGLGSAPEGIRMPMAVSSIANNLASTDPQAALQWAAQLPPQQRDEAQFSAVTTRSIRDPEAATAWVLSQPDTQQNQALIQSSLMAVIHTNPESATLLYENLPANICLLYTSPSPRDQRGSRMPSSA